MQVRFIIGAVRPEQFPPEELPEVAFLGRSNVGKSSLLNRLVRSDGIARISSWPGCTRTINFYRVDERMLFADLPGYGYAKISIEQRKAWRPVIESYLAGRRSLEICLLLLDARRGWMEPDLELQRWLEFHRRRYQVVATKFDKLDSRKQKQDGLAAIRSHCGGVEPIPFSAVTGQGVRELWQTITTISR